MLPPTYPAYPPTVLLALMFILELSFGFFYNWFFRWVKLNVALAVVIGVFLTGAILYPFVWNYILRGEQWLLISLIAFAGSGTPMATLSIQRDRAESHHRRPIPNHVKHTFEEISIALYALTDDMEKACADKITAGTLVHWVNSLHEIKGMAKVS